MVLDRPEHKMMLLQLIEASSIPGKALDKAYALKKAIEAATCKPPKKSGD